MEAIIEPKNQNHARLSRGNLRIRVSKKVSALFYLESKIHGFFFDKLYIVGARELVTRTGTTRKVGKRGRKVYIKKAPASAQPFGQSTAVTIPVEQSSDRPQSSRELA